jgi:transcriptional regulator with XRE-family HTH domain/DNA-binding Lrp family transcriptional regulator
VNQLKEFREEAMMTVRELSERSGVSEDTITKIENSHRKGRSMTLRKLAKALGIEPHQLSPEQFAQKAEPEVLPQNKFFRSDMATANLSGNTIEDAHTAYLLEAAIARAYDVMRAIEQPAEKPSPQERYADGVPRMTISERQQRVLNTVLECGEVSPSTVADQLGISVSTAYRDLSILEEYGLVAAEESGKRVISPLGRGLVEAVLDTQDDSTGNYQNTLYYDEALNHIATLMEAYESVAEFDPHRATGKDKASFHLLQEITIQSMRRIIAAAEPRPDADMPTQPSHRALWTNWIESEAPTDPRDISTGVWTMLSRYVTSPPSQQTIRADIEGVPETDIWHAVRETAAAYLMGKYEPEGQGPERMYENFLSKLREPRPRHYSAQRGGGNSPQQAQIRRIDS